MTNSRLFEHLFYTSSEKLSLRSSEVWEKDLLLGFIGPKSFEARQMLPRESKLFITIDREEMNELCDYWQKYRLEHFEEGDDG